MADKNWRERLESIGKKGPDEASKRILADIEANKKRNKELSDKRTRDAVESVLNQGSGAADSSAKASSKPKKAGKSSKTSSTSSVGASRASTTVRAQKGGSMTAETTTKEVRNQANLQKETERILNSPREKSKQSSQNTASSSNKNAMRIEGDRPLFNSKLSQSIKNFSRNIKESGERLRIREEQRLKEHRERKKKKKEQ